MQDLTTGSITRHLLKTSSYMLVGMVFQTLYILVDLYWVAHLGTPAVAAVGLCGNLTFIVLAATQMLGVGTTTLVAQAAGRKDRDRANHVFNESVVLAVVVGLVFFALAWAVRDAYSTALSADAETGRLAKIYLGWFIPAMALQFGLVSLGAALRGIGLFRPGMLAQSATVILNIILAPIFIFGWGTGRPMGVAGAAFATFVAIAAGSIGMALYFKRATSFLVFHRRDWRPDWKLWRDLLKIGLPAGAEFALMSVYLLIVYMVSRPFGASAQAGFGIGLRIVQAAFLPVVALGFAVAPVAGQNFGARQGQRVRATFRVAATMAASIMAVTAVLIHLFPGAVMRLFTSDPAVTQVGVEYLRIITWNFVASGVIFVSSSVFQGMGNTIPPLVASGTRIVILAIPVLWLSHVRGFELRWIWYLSVAAVVLQVTINLTLLRREFARRLAFSPGV